MQHLFADQLSMIFTINAYPGLCFGYYESNNLVADPPRISLSGSFREARFWVAFSLIVNQ